MRGIMDTEKEYDEAHCNNEYIKLYILYSLVCELYGRFHILHRTLNATSITEES